MRSNWAVWTFGHAKSSVWIPIEQLKNYVLWKEAVENVRRSNTWLLLCPKISGSTAFRSESRRRARLRHHRGKVIAR